MRQMGPHNIRVKYNKFCSDIFLVTGYYLIIEWVKNKINCLPKKIIGKYQKFQFD